MPHSTRIYLDNAATSWPKPETVYESVDQYQREIGVAAGRGSYCQADDVDRTIQQVRVNLAKLIGTPSKSHVVFAHNCTDALNLVLHGLLEAADHVVTSDAEHNSILRPLAELRKRLGLTVSCVGVDSQGRVDLNRLRDSITSTTRLVAVTHASNVTGALQPIAEISDIAKEYGCLLLVDAAQTLGHVSIDLQSCPVDFLAAPGHKGLLGPLGTGVLFIAPDLEQQVRSFRQGGTGTKSEDATQPEELPAKYEAGNLNVPGLVGLDAGVRFVLEHDLAAKSELTVFTQRLIDGFLDVPQVTLYSRPNESGIVSFNVEGYDPGEVASLLDATGDIQVRAGLHCAPLMHRHLGTLSRGGAVRASFGHYNTAGHVDQLIERVRAFAVTAVK